MLNNKQLKQLTADGYVRITNFLDKDEIRVMLETMSEFKDTHYNEDNLRNRVAYLSDTSDTRVSNAFMVSTGTSPLPHISVEDDSTLGNIINDYQSILMQTTVGESRNTRLMFNMQEYKEASKPIPWHFDGEYLDFNDGEDDGQIDLKKGLIPQFVGVYTLYNNNELATGVRDLVTGEEFQVESEAGDLFLFDNTRFLHSVPELDKDRAMFGFRNFDFNPYLYQQDYTLGSLPITNQCFKGFASKTTTENSELLQEDFIEDWKNLYSSDLKAKF